MNEAGWACERTFTPLPDFESALKREGLPLYSLETFTPLGRFDVVGFSLQYEICYTNVLTMLDLGGIALHAEDRGADDTLVIAGGPGAQNPELLAPFIDLFVIGDGEPSLPVVCDLWKSMQGTGLSREEKLARIAGSVEWAYVPRFYEPIYAEDGTIVEIRRTRDDVPAEIKPCVIRDLDSIPLPTRPVVPFVETAHDRIAIEIMRGCPWLCRFCQSTVIKRPLRHRTVETIVAAALESYRSTGYDEISLLSLSTSDYPDFEELVTRMSEVFTPLGVKISLPSLRITETLKKIPALLSEGRRSGLTLAPEVARDDMRQQIRKPINNQDLYDGCAEAFRRGWRKVKLYFMCGLPGERAADLDGIVAMAETIARIGKDVTGRYADVTASVSNFIPKPHTPYQWNGLQSRDYFHWAHRYLKSKVKVRSVTVKCHDIERSMLEGILTRGDRRVAAALEAAWSRGARLDAWSEYFNPQALVGDFRRSGNRRSVLQPPRAADRRGASLGPHSHQVRPRVPGQGAISFVCATRGDGRGGVGLSESVRIVFRTANDGIARRGLTRFSGELNHGNRNADQASDRRRVHGRRSWRGNVRAGSRGDCRNAAADAGTRACLW